MIISPQFKIQNLQSEFFTKTPSTVLLTHLLYALSLAHLRGYWRSLSPKLNISLSHRDGIERFTTATKERKPLQIEIRQNHCDVNGLWGDNLPLPQTVESADKFTNFVLSSFSCETEHQVITSVEVNDS